MTYRMFTLLRQRPQNYKRMMRTAVRSWQVRACVDTVRMAYYRRRFAPLSIAVRARDYPTVKRAIEIMLADSGVPLPKTWPDTLLPETNDDPAFIELDGCKLDWQLAEQFLSTLDDGDLRSFCSGEQSDAETLATFNGRPAMMAHVALNTVFNRA